MFTRPNRRTKDYVEPPRPPLPARLALAGLLPLIAALIYFDGQRYSSDLLDFEGKAGTYSESADLFPDTLQNLPRFGQVRSFDQDNLYEYINGHAEFFLSAGFKALAVAEYAPEGASAPALVINLYDMGKPLHAFGVLMDEAASGEAVDVGTMGFAGGQGVNFIHGPYYIQLSTFGAIVQPLSAAREAAAELTRRSTAATLEFQFPDLGQVETTRFVKEDYRGLSFLDNVLERTFQRNGGSVAVFMLNGAAEDIVRRVQELTAFLDEDGIGYEVLERGSNKVYRVRDPYEGEWFFLAQAERLLGVFAALDDALLEAVIEKPIRD